MARAAPAFAMLCGALLLAAPALAAGRTASSRPDAPADACRTGALLRTALVLPAGAPDPCCSGTRPVGACPALLSTRALVHAPATHAL